MGGKKSRKIKYPGLSSTEFEDQFSTKPTQSFESESIGCDSDNDSDTSHLGGYPIGHSYKPKLNLQGIGLQRGYRAGCKKADLRVDEGGKNYGQGRGLACQPAFLSDETNIEIPLTPLTNYDKTHFSPRGLESDADDESVPSPANSDGIMMQSTGGTSCSESEAVTQEGSLKKGFFSFGNKQRLARKSGVSDAAVLLSAYAGKHSSSGYNYS